ncbi:MAG: GyrI-like domain-containing protein [Pseudobdellovibrio sp.]
MTSQKKTDAFRVIGISIRTKNSAELSGHGKIGPLWNEYISKSISEKIPDKINYETIAVYYDYETDATGYFSMLIGAKVKPNTTPPTGMVAIDIPAQTSEVITSDKGEMPAVIISAWQQIWLKTEQNELNRKYSFDYELYDERSINPSAGQIDIYITVK